VRREDKRSDMKTLISMVDVLIQEEDEKENEEIQNQHNHIRNKHGLKLVIDKIITVGISRTLTKFQNKR
jgi:hypothetical protein